MHEMGIANSVLEAVHLELRHHERERSRPMRAIKVGLRIGEFAAVDPESLRFCFDAIKKGTEFEMLQLEIDWRPGSDVLDFTELEIEDQAGELCSAIEGEACGCLAGREEAGVSG